MENIGNNIGLTVAKTRDSIRENIWYNTKVSIRNNIGNNVWNSIADNLKHEIWWNIRGNLRNNIPPKSPISPQTKQIINEQIKRPHGQF